MIVPFLYRIGAAVAVALAMLWYVTDLRHDRDSARQEAAQARSAEKAAHAQADLNTTAGEAVEAAQSRSLSITVKSQEAAHAVSVAPGGDGVVPPAVLERWSVAIDGLRAEASAHGDAASPGPGDAAGAVSTPAKAD